MLFSDYKNHKNAVINPKLLWEYDLNGFDYIGMRNLVVQRVVERGWPDDYFAILNLYGEDGVKDAIRQISSLNKKDMNFVSKVFSIPLTELKCYSRQLSKNPHWSY